ncbi:MAG: DUF2336 domain-containing protein [Rhizobiales bacterium]|nr:DUF2336 domain-containing protein [Hyphomicrobiales bacterium]
MLVKSFLAWIENAGPRERAEAVDMLAQAYMAGTLGDETPGEAEAALTIVLDDPARAVRRTLACAFAEFAAAPRHIVRALAADHAEVAAPLLARSPVLQEADLMDLASTSDVLALIAIALRPVVSMRTSHALIERGELDVALALSGNPGAEIADRDLLTLATAFGQDSRIRMVLMGRDRLPATARHQLMIAVSESLGNFVTDGGFLGGMKQKRAFDDALHQGTIEIAVKAGDDLPDLVRHLRETARLTPALLLRGVLGGDLGLLREALAELSGMESGRVASLMRSRADATLAALFRRAGLPGFLERPLIAAIRAAQELPEEARGAALSLPVIRATEAACLDFEGGEDVRLLALLRRYEAEAARAESLRLAEGLRLQAQNDLAALSFSPEQMSDLADLGSEASEAEVIELQPSAVVTIGTTAAPEPEKTPDLRTIIADWKREREARQGYAEDMRLPAPSNRDPGFDEWDIRRRTA